MLQLVLVPVKLLICALLLDVLLHLQQLVWRSSLSSPSETDVPEHKPPPVANDQLSVLLKLGWEYPVLLSFAKINELLNPHNRSEPLQVVDVGIDLVVPLVPHDIAHSKRVQIDPDLLVGDGNTVLILISGWVVGVTEGKLNTNAKGINKVVVGYADFVVENILHHLMDYLSIDYLVDAHLRAFCTVPDTVGNKHLTHGVPVDADVFDFIQLNDCA